MEYENSGVSWVATPRWELELSIADVFKRVAGGRHGTPVVEVVGSIIDQPVVVRDSGNGAEALVFHLDSRRELEFRQPVSALSASHKRGERVKVTCHLEGGVAIVDWIEKV